jgi:hypothetical protein
MVALARLGMRWGDEMAPDGVKLTFVEELKFWLRYAVHRCYLCGRLLWFTPFTDCEPCTVARIVRETCPACHEPAYILNEASNVTRCLVCGYAG